MKHIKQSTHIFQRKNKLALACLAGMSLMSSQVIASTIIGQVTDGKAAHYFSGANIKIKQLGLEAISQSDGSYRFDNIPAGDYTLVVEYLGSEPVEMPIRVSENGVVKQNLALANSQQQMENLVVYAQRAGQAGALNMQKNSDSIKSIVSADAIGQFPDQNVSEALQRLPGLFIERDQGEGRFVGIRGIDPNLNNVTINGLNVPSPEAGVRSVALDVIPSQLIGGLVVSKSVTSDMDADAIGGSIEVKSLSGFDRAEQSMSVAGQLSHNELRGETSPKIAASFTDVYEFANAEQLAVAAAISYQDRKFGSDNIESNGEDEIEQRFYAVKRERTGAAVNLDYRPDFNNQYFLRTLYSKFADDEFRLRNTFALEDGEVERDTKDRNETQTILSLTAGGEHDINGWQLDYQLGYSKSTEKNPNALYYTLKGEDFDISSDMQGPKPRIMQSANTMDLSNYVLDEIANESENSEDKERSFKLDLTKSVMMGSRHVEFKVGTKYREREKTTNANIEIFDGGFDNFIISDFATAQPDWGFGEFGPGLNRGALKQYYTNNSNAFDLVKLDSQLESQGASYSINEDIFAAYAMAKFDIENLRVIAGLRYEKTDFSTLGARVELIEDESAANEEDQEKVVNTVWQTENSYNKVLPSINLRYAFSDQLIARAAYTQTLARPKFGDVGAYQIIESKTEENDEGGFDTEREAEAGNPTLKPYFADNYDLSLEYYPGHIGVLSIGYFQKNIENFIVIADMAGTADWQGFDEVAQPINGVDAKLSGVELAWVKSFDNGLLISTNATFTDSEATTLLDGEAYKTSLPNQADTIANLTFGYETDLLSLRLTGVYKSKNLEEIEGDLLRFEDDHTQIDFSGKYYLNQNTHLYFNAVNLTDEPMYHYFDSPSTNAQYESYGRTFEIGFSWNSF